MAFLGVDRPTPKRSGLENLALALQVATQIKGFFPTEQDRLQLQAAKLTVDKAMREKEDDLTGVLSKSKIATEMLEKGKWKESKEGDPGATKFLERSDQGVQDRYLSPVLDYAQSLDIQNKQLNIRKSQQDIAKSDRDKATPQQFQTGHFAVRAKQAEDVFSNLQKSGYDPASTKAAVGRALPGVLEGLRPEEVKKQAQAERNFVNALLRRESGAAISPSEFKSAEMQYFPRIGDQPSVLEQKTANRLAAMSALETEAGPALSLIQQTINKNSAEAKKNKKPSPPGAEIYSDPKTGIVYRRNAKGDLEEL